MQTRTTWLIGTSLLIALFVMVFTTYGGGWGGVRATGGSLTVSGTGYGLGQVDEAKIVAELSGYIVCVNHGTNVAPGQNSFTTVVEKSQTVTVRNGRFDFNFYFSDAELGLPTDAVVAGCPNANWAVEYLHDQLNFTLQEVEDGVAVNRTAASFSCSMNPPALEGDYACSQQ